MGKLLEGYRAALAEAHPQRLHAASREARLTVYKALFARWGVERMTRHMPAIIAVLDTAYFEFDTA
jgi:hypothetical protein